MDKNCICPPPSRKRKQVTKHKDVSEIIEALSALSECSGPSRLSSHTERYKKCRAQPKRKRKTNVAPSIETRMRFAGHCPLTPAKKGLAMKGSTARDFDLSEDERCRKGSKKKVRYIDKSSTQIVFPEPVPCVRHSESNKSMLDVPSPKISGENIQAQRTIAKPKEYNPPLPPKAADKVFKPHSGIIINEDPDFVPDVVALTGRGKIPMPARKKKRPCDKGGVCYKKCHKKKCRKAQKLRRKRLRRARSEGQYGGKGRRSSRQMEDEEDACGLDEIPKPEHVQIPANLRRGTLQTHSLTVLPCTKERKPQIHYGILTGSFNMYDAKFGARSRGRQALTMSVMAYCLAFHYHPKQWTMKLVDNLVDAGDQWYIQCADKVHDHSAVQGMCEVLPFGKKQILSLNGKKMQVLLAEPDVVGYTMSLDPTVYNLCRGLRVFFKENRAGVMLTRVLKVIIWKDRICYYIFDPAGRDSRAYSNFANGQAALINVKDLESVAEVLLARTLVEDQKYVLAPVKVLKMVDEKDDEDLESDKELTQAEKAMMGFRILNENCAIVNANMHLGDRCFEDAKYRQALPMCVVAMTYAKISPPNTWYSKTLDKILRLGNKLYVDSIHPKVMIDISIDNIPNEIMLGPYACEVIIYRERVKGQLFTTKECLFNIRTGMEDFFSHEYNSGILEFNNYSLGIWRQKEMYYLFDPYPRTNDGLRSARTGRACLLMLLNPDVMATAFTKNWDYMPATTQFYIHAFKVLKLKKREPKSNIVCTLSDENLPGAKKIGRKVLPEAKAFGDAVETVHDVYAADLPEQRPFGPQIDEEKMGDIVSLVDSIQEDYLPPIPLRYKNMQSEPLPPKIVNLDSPTVSVTQVVPPWPKPRDKSNEIPEPDPDPEPTPPPTPPELPPPEGGEEEEELGEEEAEERRKLEEAKKKAEEEERRKQEELPPPLPPPPPSPQPEPELAVEPPPPLDDEIQTLEPVKVDRRLLLTEDARRRFKLRQLRRKMTLPLSEPAEDAPKEEELKKPTNFKGLPDGTQIIKASAAIGDDKAIDMLPFAAIMAIVTSYKYTISTWTPGIVSFVVDTAKKLYQNKQEKFQLAPVHIIPKIAIGKQAYQANIDVAGEGATWQLEDTLTNKFFPRFDRGMVTTASYSCAVFHRNGLYYLFDATPCNPMGLRDNGKTGKGCFMRFTTLHDLVTRIQFNKGGKSDEQQFILSRIVVRRLLTEPRMKLPEDYDYETQQAKGKKSRPSLVPQDKSKTKIDEPETKSRTQIGYQLVNGVYKIEGSTALTNRKTSADVKSCHFVCLVAMLMATMHPVRTWTNVMVDSCIEKGLEIHEKATNFAVCERRVVKNLILDGKIININIKKILVINENPVKTLQQYITAVLRRLRYVLVKFPAGSMVVCQTDGYLHLFDPYGATEPPEKEKEPEASKSRTSVASVKKQSNVANWTLYPTAEALIKRLNKQLGKGADNPEFYTFELTSFKTAPKHAMIAYKLSPVFRPDDNPNMQYLKTRKIRPLVDEKMYWLNVDAIPWSRMSSINDLGFDRKTPRTMWKDWDIEFPGDLYSLWGSLHPLDTRFEEKHRGKQYLATCVVALAMTQAVDLSAWTSGLLDGIVRTGDAYHAKCLSKIGGGKNVEVTLENLDSKFDEYPYSFQMKFENVIFGFVYNIYPDRFNLSKALAYFFEKHRFGIFVCPVKNFAFGKINSSYFMFDCQSYGGPIFCPGQGAGYILKCESLNRLIYCMTMTLNVKRHGQQFHLYSANVTLNEKSK